MKIGTIEKIDECAKKIVAVLNETEMELIYLDRVFETVKTEIDLHTVPCHPKNYKPEKLPPMPKIFTQVMP